MGGVSISHNSPWRYEERGKSRSIHGGRQHPFGRTSAKDRTRTTTAGRLRSSAINDGGEPLVVGETLAADITSRRDGVRPSPGGPTSGAIERDQSRAAAHGRARRALHVIVGGNGEAAVCEAILTGRRQARRPKREQGQMGLPRKRIASTATAKTNGRSRMSAKAESKIIRGRIRKTASRTSAEKARLREKVNHRL